MTVDVRGRERVRAEKSRRRRGRRRVNYVYNDARKNFAVSLAYRDVHFRVTSEPAKKEEVEKHNENAL